MTDTELEDWQYLKSRMNHDGFHYCFKHYSNFDEILNIRFHKLRLAYLKAAEELEKYINEKASENF